MKKPILKPRPKGTHFTSVHIPWEEVDSKIWIANRIGFDSMSGRKNAFYFWFERDKWLSG